MIENNNSSINIDATSQILVAGRSPDTTGTAPAQGAAFIGDGGYCVAPSAAQNKSFGVYNSIPTVGVNNTQTIMNTAGQIGSMGTANDVKTYGGGRIVLICDSLNL